MNKKFSTLVASLLLAGALVMPMGAYAEVTPGDAFASEAIHQLVTGYSSWGKYFLVTEVTGSPKVLTAGAGAVTAVGVEEATAASLWTIEGAESGKIYLVNNAGQYLKVSTANGSTVTVAFGVKGDASAFEFMDDKNGSAHTTIAFGTTYESGGTKDAVIYLGNTGEFAVNAQQTDLTSVTDACELAACTVKAPAVAVTPGYSNLQMNQYVSADVARYLLTGEGEGLAIAGSGTTTDDTDFSNIRIAANPAGAGYLLYVVDEDGKVTGSVSVDGSDLITGKTNSVFEFVAVPGAPEGSPYHYLGYNDGSKDYVLNIEGEFIEYDGEALPGAVVITISEIATPDAVVLGDKYVAANPTEGGKFNLALTNEGALKFVGANLQASETPVEWTLSKNPAGDDTYFLSIGGKFVSVDGATVSVGDKVSPLKLEKDLDTGNYYLTSEGLYLTFNGTAIAAEQAADVKETGRPVNPLAIQFCVAKAETPDFTNAEPNDIVVDFAKDAVGKYNYITYGADFLANKAGEATTNAAEAAMWKVTKVSEGLYKIADEDGNKVAFDADGTFDSKDGKYSNFNYVGGKLSFTTTNDTYYVYSEGGVWKASNDIADAQNDVVFYVSTLSADNNEGIKFLNGQLGNSFEVVFKEYNKDGDLEEMAVEANPFINGEIVAVPGRKFTAIDAAHENAPADLSGKMFLKVAGSYPLTDAQLAGLTAAQKNQKQLDAFRASTFIAVGTSRYSSRITDVNDNNFFEYVTVKGSAMISKWGSILAASQWSGLNDKQYAALFEEGHKLYGVTNYIENAEFVVENYQKDSYSDPMYLKAAKVYVLPTNNKNEDKDAALKDFEDVENLYVAVKTYNKVNYVGAYRESYDKVYFGTNNQVKQKDIVGIVNIVSRNYRTNGKVYATSDAYRWSKVNDADAYNRIDKFEEGRVVLHNPEGQFYVKADGKNNFTFQNRESGEYLFGSVWNATDEVYEPITVTLKKVPGKDDVYAVGNAAKDTILIAEATVGNIFDGYADYNKETQLENKAYNILVKSGVTGVEDVYLAENHKNKHTIGASADAADAVNWRLTKFTAPGNTESLYNDTIYVIRDNAVSYLSNGAYKLKKDTIAMFAYAMYNESNGEYLNYDGSTNGRAYYCNPDMVEGKASADAIRDYASKFILKEKNDGTYNLVVVYGNGRFNDGTDAEYYHAFGMSDTKAYIGVNDAKLNNEESIYKISDNDLFIIKEVDAPKYRSVATFDTIRIYKNDNEKIALYERGNFLGMQHLADVPNMAAAMFVDTAYVSNTNKPQYLLVVEPELIWHNADCNIPGHPAVDPTAVDTVKGRFLVNMVDSLNAWGNIHNNPYEWETYPKLAFKNGYHAANKLVIETAKPSAADVIDLSKNVDKIGTFAFRYIDRSQESFVIETGTKDSKGNAGTGYIKWLNGTPVVVPSIALAEVFNLDANEASDPTANEGITATGVSVVATDGAVIVKGAAGKTVAISNILGQTIANTVLSSDNETIAAPAGVVVVAVEGEAAVKAIVK